MENQNKLLQNESKSFENQFEKISIDLADKGYAVCDDFIDRNHVTQLIEILTKHRQEGNLKKAGIGTNQNFQIENQIRGDYIRWIDFKDALPATKAYLEKIKSLMLYINRTCFLGLKDFESHYTVYPSGTFYARHLDQFKHNDHRRLSFIIYLNTEWMKNDGGELKIYLPDSDEVLIEPVAGRFICFRSDLLEHEVMVCNNERLSITGWMLDQLSDLTFL